MVRLLVPILFLILSMGACNPEGPSGPKPFSIFDVYGLWKMKTDDTGCAPAQVFNIDFGPFGVAPSQDSIRVSGDWYLDEVNPPSHKMTGHIFRDSGIAFFSMNDFDTEIVEGIFVSNRDFSGAYRKLGGCSVRLRGRFIE